jgi:hypothetical protein
MKSTSGTQQNPLLQTTLGKQRQLASDASGTSKDLQMSFKTTSNVAKGLTQERVLIQNEFQKIAGGKHCQTSP